MSAASSPSSSPPADQPDFPAPSTVKFPHEATGPVYTERDLALLDLVGVPVMINDVQAWHVRYMNPMALRFWGVDHVSEIDISEASEGVREASRAGVQSYIDGQTTTYVERAITFYPKGVPRRRNYRPVAVRLQLEGMPEPVVCELATIAAAMKPVGRAETTSLNAMGYTAARFYSYSADATTDEVLAAAAEASADAETSKTAEGADSTSARTGGDESIHVGAGNAAGASDSTSDADHRHVAFESGADSGRSGSAEESVATAASHGSALPPRSPVRSPARSASGSLEPAKSPSPSGSPGSGSGSAPPSSAAPELDLQAVDTALWSNNAAQVEAARSSRHAKYAKSAGFAWHFIGATIVPDDLATASASRSGSHAHHGHHHTSAGGDSAPGTNTPTSEPAPGPKMSAARKLTRRSSSTASTASSAPSTSRLASAHSSRSDRLVLHRPGIVRAEDALDARDALVRACRDPAVQFGTLLMSELLLFTAPDDDSEHGGSDDPADGAAASAAGAASTAGDAPHPGAGGGVTPGRNAQSPGESSVAAGAHSATPHATATGDVWLRIRVRKIRDEVTGRPALLVLEDDETTLRRADDALKKAVKEIERKNDFVGKFSHEIRTPMNGILGMLECLQGTKLSEQQLDLVDTAVYSATALLSTLQDVLDLRRAAVTGLDVTRVVTKGVKLTSMVEEIGIMFAAVADSRGVVMQVDYPASLTHDDVAVVADVQRLRQIAINLVSNAVKATSVGSITLSVRVMAIPSRIVAAALPPTADVSRRGAGASAGSKGEAGAGSAASGSARTGVDSGGADEGDTSYCAIVVSVTDTGRGIDAKNMKRIFDAFFTESSKAQGAVPTQDAGVGLHLVQLLVKAMGAKITVRSKVGVGSTFSVVVPSPCPGGAWWVHETPVDGAIPPRASAPAPSLACSAVADADLERAMATFASKGYHASGPEYASQAFGGSDDESVEMHAVTSPRAIRGVAVPSPRSLLAPGARPLTNLWLLVVGDSQDSLLLWSLQRAGATIVQAENARAAVVILRQRYPPGTPSSWHGMSRTTSERSRVSSPRGTTPRRGASFEDADSDIGASAAAGAGRPAAAAALSPSHRAVGAATSPRLGGGLARRDGSGAVRVDLELDIAATKWIDVVLVTSTAAAPAADADGGVAGIERVDEAPLSSMMALPQYKAFYDYVTAVPVSPLRLFELMSTIVHKSGAASVAGSQPAAGHMLSYGGRLTRAGGDDDGDADGGDEAGFGAGVGFDSKANSKVTAGAGSRATASSRRKGLGSGGGGGAAASVASRRSLGSGARASVASRAAAPPDPDDSLAPNGRILCVDDSPINLKVVTRLLRGIAPGAVVTTGADGTDAVDIVREAGPRAPFDAVFMDLSMERLGGVEATEQIRAIERQWRTEQEATGAASDEEYEPAPIIALTAHAHNQAHTRQVCCSRGMSDLITKPVSQEMLRSVLDKWAPQIRLVEPAGRRRKGGRPPAERL